jgi:catechol 2,3-dioxygenase-like lactoylglutathione lyase family enzyme
MAVLKTAAHTGITVRDLDESIALWRDVLGFELWERLELLGASRACTALRDRLQFTT